MDRKGLPSLEGAMNFRTKGCKVVGSGVMRDGTIGPIAFRGEITSRPLDLSITDTAGCQMSTQHLLGCCNYLNGVVEPTQAVAQPDEEVEALFAEHLRGRFMHDAENAGHIAGFIMDWTVRESPPCLLRVSFPLNGDRQILEVTGLSGEGLLRDWPHHVPGFRPDLPKRTAQSLGLGAQHRSVGIIVEG